MADFARPAFVTTLVLIFLFFAALFFAVFSHMVDNAIPDAELCQFHVGTTTSAQILSALGAPKAALTSGDAQDQLLFERLTWNGTERYVFSFRHSTLAGLTLTAMEPQGSDDQGRRGGPAPNPRRRMLPSCISGQSPSAPGAP